MKSLQTAFDTARRKAGFPELSFHDLHIAARMALTEGLDIVGKVLSILL